MTDSLIDTNDPIELDENKDYFAELVGEGKKFKDEKDLAKGKFLADQYIDFKNKEYDELRADYLKLKEESTATGRLQELLDKLESKADLTSNEHPDVKEDKQPILAPEQIESLVSTQVEKLEAKKKADANFAKVQAKLKEKFGSNYPSILKTQIQSLGLDSKDVDDLARKSPDAFFRTFGLDQKAETFQAPPPSSHRSDNFLQKSGEVRNKKFYDKLKKENPELYTNPKTQVQMHNDAIAMGWEKFNS